MSPKAQSGTSSGQNSIRTGTNLKAMDKVLDLVTEHETTVRNQQIQYVQMSKRVSELEQTLKNVLGPLKKVDLSQDLDDTKFQVETLRGQFVSFGNEAESARLSHQSEVKSLRSKTEKLERSVSGMRDELGSLQRDMSDFKATQTEMIHDIKRSQKSFLHDVLDRVGTQFEKLKAELLRDVQQTQSKVSEIEERHKSELAICREQLEIRLAGIEEKENGLTKGSANQQHNLQSALQRMDDISKEHEKLQRRVYKLQAHRSESATTSSSTAKQLEEAVQHLQTESVSLRTSLTTLKASVEDREGEASSLTSDVRDAHKQLAKLDDSLKDRSKDLTALADAFGEYIHSRAAAPAPTAALQESTNNIKHQARPRSSMSITAEDALAHLTSGAYSSFYNPLPTASLSTGSSIAGPYTSRSINGLIGMAVHERNQEMMRSEKPVATSDAVRDAPDLTSFDTCIEKIKRRVNRDMKDKEKHEPRKHQVHHYHHHASRSSASGAQRSSSSGSSGDNATGPKVTCSAPEHGEGSHRPRHHHHYDNDPDSGGKSVNTGRSQGSGSRNTCTSCGAAH